MDIPFLYSAHLYVHIVHKSMHSSNPSFRTIIYRVENGRPAFTIPTRDPAENISLIHNRMPVLLPSVIVPDWINPKYSAGDLLRNAILDVHYRPAGSAAPEQIGMDV